MIRIFKQRRLLVIVSIITIFCSRLYAAPNKAEQQLTLVKEYLAAHPDDLPMIIGIPGFRVPGVTIPQEQHFGQLEQIAQEWGIPYYCMAYDSDAYPLRMVADLASTRYSIATTRVIPNIVRTIKFEKERRAELGLPPVKDVILFMYSQGTVVSYGFVRQLHYYRRLYDAYHDKFGEEWDALQHDPVFNSFRYALDTYTLIKNIQAQREKDFEIDPDLRLFYTRTSEEMNIKNDDLIGYLADPHTLYPGVEQFDPPNTNKYPKAYVKVRELARLLQSDESEKEKILNFMKDHSLLCEVRDVNFMYFSAAGSIFGSPHANEGYDILRTVPVGHFLVKGVNQIKDTRVGSFHHTRKIENLVRESKLPNYPITKENTLFIVGANEEEGDGLVDQPSAHISGHALAELDVTQKEHHEKSGEPIHVAMEVIPELHVVPLEVHHFPVKTFWGLGPTLPGAAYMTPGHEVLDYLIPFMFKDFDRIEQLKADNDVYLRQFMLEFTFRHITGGAETDQQVEERRKRLLSGLLTTFIKDLDVRLVNKPDDIVIQGKYFNADNLTYVIIGSYREAFFYADKPEEKTMDFDIRARGYDPILLTLPIRAGKILFVNIKLERSNGTEEQEN